MLSIKSLIGIYNFIQHYNFRYNSKMTYIWKCTNFCFKQFKYPSAQKIFGSQALL